MFNVSKKKLTTRNTQESLKSTFKKKLLSIKIETMYMKNIRNNVLYFF